MKKTQIITLIGCFAIAALFGSFLLGCGGESQQVNLTEKMHADFPNIKAASSVELELPTSTNYNLPGGNIMVYKVLSPQVTVPYVENIGSRFEITGGAGAADSFSIGMVDKQSDTTRTLRVFTNSGGIEYMIPEEWFPVVESQPTLPSVEESKAVAIDFLKQTDLLPDDYTKIEVIDGSTQTTVDGDSGTANEYVVIRHVVFYREIDGKPIMGPGQKLKVFVGENGIVGAQILWRDVEPYKELPLKSIQQAITDLNQGKYGTYSVLAETTKAFITDIRLGYWISPATHNQEYVVPVYELKGVCLDKNGNELGSFDGWCEAL